MYIDYQKQTTVKSKISGTGFANQVSTALTADTSRNSRSVRRRRFCGAVIYNDATSTQALTPLIEVTNGTTSFQLDRTVIQIGESAVWSDEEYGIDLDGDQFIKVTVAESIATNDDLYVFLKFKDFYS